MNKYYSLMLLIFLVPIVSAQIEIFGTDNDRVINLESVITVITTFLGLSDTPASYATHGGECVKVNAGETALEFGACGTGSGNGTGKAGDGGYLFNNSITMFFNDTLLNQTIEDKSINQSDADDLYINELGDTMDGNLVLRNRTVSIIDNSSLIRMFFEGGIFVVEG